MRRTPRQFHVLIASDGSPAAKAAVATAVDFPWPDGTGASAVVAKQARGDLRLSILLAALDRTSELVAKGAARVLSRRWPDVEARIVDASPGDAIVREARRRWADVIVMGWRGHGAVRRMLIGSVSRDVVRRASCAVLVVKHPRRNVRRMVIGFDGSAQARRAVALISRLRAPRGGRVVLFTAVDTMRALSHALMPPATGAAVSAQVMRMNKTRLAKARHALDRAARSLSRAGWKVDVKVTTGAPLHDLLATAANNGSDLVVVGARGVTGVRHLLLGSVAEGALNRSPVPVLIVR